MVGIIMRCVRGEEWISESFKSYVQVQDNPITEDSIIFCCPVGHEFTLKKALAKSIFTKEEADKLINQANKLKEQCVVGNRDWQASYFIPNEEISALNIPCVRCGKRAQLSAMGMSEDMAERKRLALCLGCMADWYNQNNKAFKLLTWGKASDLFREAIFDRFVRHLPSLDLPEAEKILKECRKKVRKISSRRPH